MSKLPLFLLLLPLILHSQRTHVSAADHSDWQRMNIGRVAWMMFLYKGKENAQGVLVSDEQALTSKNFCGNDKAQIGAGTMEFAKDKKIDTIITQEHKVHEQLCTMKTSAEKRMGPYVGRAILAPHTFAKPPVGYKWYLVAFLKNHNGSKSAGELFYRVVYHADSQEGYGYVRLAGSADGKVMLPMLPELEGATLLDPASWMVVGVVVQTEKNEHIRAAWIPHFVKAIAHDRGVDY